MHIRRVHAHVCVWSAYAHAFRARPARELGIKESELTRVCRRAAAKNRRRNSRFARGSSPLAISSRPPLCVPRLSSYRDRPARSQDSVRPEGTAWRWRIFRVFVIFSPKWPLPPPTTHHPPPPFLFYRLSAEFRRSHWQPRRTMHGPLDRHVVPRLSFISAKTTNVCVRTPRDRDLFTTCT